VKRAKKDRRSEHDKTSIKVAFITTGQADMAKAWGRYAHSMVGSSGSVFAVKDQAEATQRIESLKDTQIDQLYFVGHGFSPEDGDPGGFFLSGTVGQGEPPFSADNLDQVVMGTDDAFTRAVAAKLSTRHEVLVSFLTCYSGTGGLLQRAMAASLVKHAQNAAVRVEAYEGNFLVERNLGRYAFIADKQNKPITELTAAPERPKLDIPAESRAGRKAFEDAAKALDGVVGH
jgi:hypothetical protein